MKRYGYLFEKITDIDNIKLAHKNARRGKAHYQEVKEVDADIAKYSMAIKALLESGEYKTSPYEIKFKKDKNKIREIYKLPYFPDRIVHHAIMQVLEPIWKSSLIANTFQSIKGRGPHKAIRKLKKDILHKDVYYLQLDIRKYYPSINNAKLKEAIRQKIKCTKTLQLLDGIVDSCQGVPIGNYISQYFGNIYLNQVDHNVNSITGIKYYRYCDDIVCIGGSKEVLWHSYKEILKYFTILCISVKKPILHKITVRAGLDFLGYKMYSNRILLRRSIKQRAVKHCTVDNIHSYIGWLNHCNGYNLTTKLKRIVNDRI